MKPSSLRVYSGPIYNELQSSKNFQVAEKHGTDSLLEIKSTAKTELQNFKYSPKC